MTSPHEPESWLLDDVAHAGRENLDWAHVARYDDKEDADADEEVHLRKEKGVLRASSTVHDIAAATWHLTLTTGQRGSRVTAVDVSPVMLGCLRQDVRHRGLTNVGTHHVHHDQRATRNRPDPLPTPWRDPGPIPVASDTNVECFLAGYLTYIDAWISRARLPVDTPASRGHLPIVISQRQVVVRQPNPTEEAEETEERSRRCRILL